MRRVIAVCCLLVIVCVVVTVEAEAQSHPIIGKWERNLERSTYATDPAQRAVIRYQDGEDGFIIFTRVAITPTTNPGWIHMTFRLDGAAYPFYTPGALTRFTTTGTESTTMWTFEVADANTLRYTSENNGEPGASGTWTVSPDGQTLTSARSNNNIEVYDRIKKGLK